MSGSVLAIETTGPICSVALLASDGRVVHRASREGLMHLTSLMPMVEDVLGEAGMAPRKLERIAVSAGPGSFTGMRIGIATARAFAQTLRVPVVKVPTLETFVYLPEDERPYTVCCPIFDARREQMYAGAYMLEKDGRIMTLVKGDAYSPEEYFASLGAAVAALEKLVERMDGSDTEVACLMMGDGLPVFRERIDVFVAGVRADVKIVEGAVQDAKATLAWSLAHGIPIGFEELEPIYIRKAEAQRRLDEKAAAESGVAAVPFMLRPANEDDVYGISVIERLSFGEPWLEDSIRSDLRLEYSDYVVCEKEGFILGYAGLHIILDEGHITNIAVHPSVRRSGAGGAALTELVRQAEAKGVRDFTLEVRAGDEAAVGFYEKHGFKTEGVRKGYYPASGGEREDALIMWRHGGEPQGCTGVV
ncbi:MAG: tRNA (adenosine(37)-N6)-threonylcarbamoyltransferase complex dimerization subunit type 1 TsaB [Clostridiales bacterium]|nr:tRNA (adenosine(37)-N6)-threonylcarbamoyltransferase complex dimerization subunit type 1 TsaB [Clostridiales bacterium]